MKSLSVDSSVRKVAFIESRPTVAFWSCVVLHRSLQLEAEVCSFWYFHIYFHENLHLLRVKARVNKTEKPF